ncbi:hypothetical protein LCGC14_0829800 [marine sediment metagenome]|uniref:Uncharacterized protein n=1 Tax=marine sediment metagenome TaxID=412755 RepID=A0A0F9PGB5_9ZZZZ
MEILNPNTGEDVKYISKEYIYVRIMDFKLKEILQEIIISPGQHSWEWISLSPDIPINISDLQGRYSTFNNAINRSINDPYCTIYSFRDFREMMKDWDEIKYKDIIKTQYESR